MSTLKEFSDSLIFPLGDKLPEQFSKFFIGQAHLNMLTTTGVSIGNVTFEPACLSVVKKNSDNPVFLTALLKAFATS